MKFLQRVKEGRANKGEEQKVYSELELLNKDFKGGEIDQKILQGFCCLL